MQADLFIEQIFKVLLGNEYNIQNKEDRNHIIFLKGTRCKEEHKCSSPSSSTCGVKEAL